MCVTIGLFYINTETRNLKIELLLCLMIYFYCAVFDHYRYSWHLLFGRNNLCGFIYDDKPIYEKMEEL